MNAVSRTKKTCSWQLESVSRSCCTNHSNTAKILHTKGYAESFENQLRRTLGREVNLTRAQSVKTVGDKGWHIAPKTVVSSTPDLKKRPKTSTKQEEWVDVPTRKNLRQQQHKLEAKKPEWPKRVRPEAVLVKPAKRVSYAAILKDLMEQVKPKKLGFNS